MKRLILLFFFLSAMSFNLFAAGKVYWQANGILITDRDGMTAGSPVPDGQGGVIVFASDGMDSIFAIKVDKNGNLPWTLHGKVVDDNGFGSFQGKVEAVSDGHGGAIAVWDRWFPWGHNLYYNRIDSVGDKVWAGNGVPLTLSDSTQEYHQVVSDGAGGVIAAWQEQRGGQWDIYNQRVDSMGLRQWGDYAKVVCNATGGQTEPAIVNNLPKEAIIIWLDQRTGYDLFGQRVDSSGNICWISNGINFCGYNSNQWGGGEGTIIADSYDGVELIWIDDRNSNYDIFTQRINVNGDTLWAYGGATVCINDSAQLGARLICDNTGGNIARWIDMRNGNKDIYAQRIDNNGTEKWFTGGVVICTADSTQQATKAITDNESGAIITWQDKRSGDYDIYAQHVDSSGNVKWQINGMAVCTTAYSQETPNIAPSDSNTAIIIWNDARSGYYRGYAQRVGDDPNGVEGRPGDSGQWAAFRLEQNYPNPFKQSTVIRYQVTGGGPVSLSVYNITGQLVKTLIDDPSPNALGEGRVRSEGSVTWNGCDDTGRKVSNGIYFYRIIFGEFDAIKKLVVLK